MADHNRTANSRFSLSSNSSFSSSSGLSSGEIAARIRRASSSRQMRLRSRSEESPTNKGKMITDANVSSPVRQLWSRQTIGSQPKTKPTFSISHTKSGSNIIPQVKGFPFKVTYKIRLVVRAFAINKIRLPCILHRKNVSTRLYAGVQLFSKGKPSKLQAIGCQLGSQISKRKISWFDFT